MAAFAIALIAMAATFAIAHGGPVLAPFLIGIAFFAMAGALTDLAERIQLFRQSLRRVVAPPRPDCRARRSAPRSRISASACACSASPPKPITAPSAFSR